MSARFFFFSLLLCFVRPFSPPEITGEKCHRVGGSAGELDAAAERETPDDSSVVGMRLCRPGRSFTFVFAFEILLFRGFFFSPVVFFFIFFFRFFSVSLSTDAYRDGAQKGSPPSFATVSSDAADDVSLRF